MSVVINGTSGIQLGGADLDMGSGQVLNSTFIENNQTISSNYTIGAARNAGSFGPITIADGVTVEIPEGSVWSIV